MYKKYSAFNISVFMSLQALILKVFDLNEFIKCPADSQHLVRRGNRFDTENGYLEDQQHMPRLRGRGFFRPPADMECCRPAETTCL